MNWKEKLKQKIGLSSIEEEIANTQEDVRQLETRWHSEKDIIGDVKNIQIQLEKSRIDEQNAVRESILEQGS